MSTKCIFRNQFFTSFYQFGLFERKPHPTISVISNYWKHVMMNHLWTSFVPMPVHRWFVKICNGGSFQLWFDDRLGQAYNLSYQIGLFCLTGQQLKLMYHASKLRSAQCRFIISKKSQTYEVWETCPRPVQDDTYNRLTPNVVADAVVPTELRSGQILSVRKTSLPWITFYFYAHEVVNIIQSYYGTIYLWPHPIGFRCSQLYYIVTYDFYMTHWTPTPRNPQHHTTPHHAPQPLK